MVVEMMIIRIKFYKLLHMFVLLLLCLRFPTLGLTSRVGDDGNTNIKCIEREREGLLKFKQGLIDEYGHLSSWGSEEEKKDCCSWRGVHCSNLSGHVIMLDLHNSDSSDTYKPLRGNDLTGGIPRKIGQLTSLDSLDLSNNQLSGEIPTSLTQISRLSVLDLSNNKLSGRIPLGTQLQSFNASTYMGNPGLCGAPLETCPAEKIAQDPLTDQDRLMTRGFYISMGVGFVVGFWGVCSTLLLNSSWRYAFFKLLEKIEDWFFVMFVVYTTRLKRKLQCYGLKIGAAKPEVCSS